MTANNGRGNLRPPWPKGVSGNPGGSRSAGAHYREWLNAMNDWPKADLEAVANNEKAGAVQRQAALTHLRALSVGFYHATPLAGNDLDRIADRTEGKPIARVEVARVDIDPDEARSQLAAMLEAVPGLAAAVAAMLPASAPGVDVVADVPAKPVLDADSVP